MRKIITIIILFTATAVYGQNDRVYTAAEINTINTSQLAFEGDLYYDAGSDILYIGLMDGRLVPIQDTDKQRIDVSSFTASGINLSLERDGEATKVIPVISSTANNDLTFDVDGLFINETDDQTIDVSTHDASGLNLSLEDDGAATITIPLISTTANNDLSFDTDGLFINETDDQTIDVSTHDASGLNLSLEDDGAATITIPLISTTANNGLSFNTDGLFINETDDQTIDVSTHDASGLNLSLEDDGAATITIPLISTTANNDLIFDTDGLFLDGSDDQTIDVSTHDASGLNLSLEDDGAATITIPLISTTANNDLSFNTDGLFINETDDQTIDVSTHDASGLNLSLEDDGAATVTIPLISTTANNDLSFNTDGLFINETDDQTIDVSTHDASGINLSLEDDGAATVTIPLISTTANNDLTFNTDGLFINGSDDQTIDVSTHDASGINLSLEDDGAATITIPLISTTANNDLTFNTDGLFIDGSDDQTLTYTNTDPDDNINTLQIEGSSAFNIDDNHLGTNDQTLTANRTIGLSGRSLTFDGTQDVIIESDGDVGIGTAAPAARLDVDNGSVRFSDYGVGTYMDTLASVGDAVHHLAVDANGDVVETNTVKSSKVFYPPAIVIDVSALATDVPLDLYAEYISRMGSPGISSTANPIPTYTREELEYHVLDWDTSVFNIGPGDLTTDGVLTYDVTSIPAGNCTYINVVFVVK